MIHSLFFEPCERPTFAFAPREAIQMGDLFL
jgi:hypothetical protein